MTVALAMPLSLVPRGTRRRVGRGTAVGTASSVGTWGTRGTTYKQRYSEMNAALSNDFS